MTRRVIQVVVAAGLIAAALLLRRPPRALPESPEAAVDAFFDAAGRGDDQAYLALVDGELLQSLRSTRSQVGRRTFREDLRRSAAGIKGLAKMRGGDAPEGLVALDVEIVFVDRTERQRMLLAPCRGGWVITALGAARTVKPPIPYGTPVYEE